MHSSRTLSTNIHICVQKCIQPSGDIHTRIYTPRYRLILRIFSFNTVTSVRIFSCLRRLHPEDPEFGPRCSIFRRDAQAQSKHTSCVGRIDDAVIPQSRAGVVRRALSLELLQDGIFDFGFALGPQSLARSLSFVFLDLFFQGSDVLQGGD